MIRLLRPEGGIWSTSCPFHTISRPCWMVSHSQVEYHDETLVKYQVAVWLTSVVAGIVANPSTHIPNSDPNTHSFYIYSLAPNPSPNA